MHHVYEGRDVTQQVEVLLVTRLVVMLRYYFQPVVNMHDIGTGYYCLKLLLLLLQEQTCPAQLPLQHQPQLIPVIHNVIQSKHTGYYK